MQCIYIDPPYGIKFNSNFQWSTTSREVKDGKAEHITREPEQVKAFRDTWRDGIHSYLTYLRDRLTVARDLLTESGSIFVQIGDENVHRVRGLMDEVFGEENFVRLISFRTTSGLSQKVLDKACDLYCLVCKKHRFGEVSTDLYEPKVFSNYKNSYSTMELRNGQRMTIKNWEAENGLLTNGSLPEGAEIYTFGALYRQSGSGASIVIAGQTYTLHSGSYKTTQTAGGRQPSVRS